MYEVVAVFVCHTKIFFSLISSHVTNAVSKACFFGVRRTSKEKKKTMLTKI